MFEFMVVAPGHPLPYLSSVVTTVWHSETKALLNLLVVPSEVMLTPDTHFDPNLQPGLVRHRGNQQTYHFNRLVFDPQASGVGVWYTALYLNQDSRLGPHWFRPLNTEKGAGWLDLVDGELRFERLTSDSVLANPLLPDPRE